MPRVKLLRLLVLLPALVVFAAARQAPPLEARFIGNMAWAITDGAFTLMSDFPYASGAVNGYMLYDVREIRSSTTETLALITHRHADHWSVELFAKTNWKLVGPRDVTARAPYERVVPVSPRFPYGPLRIDAMETPHAGIGHYSYVVVWHGKRMYFSGDTEEPKHLAALTDLDVAFVSPWLYRAVLKIGGVKASRVVIYHHVPGETVQECRQGCTQPKQGDILRF